MHGSDVLSDAMFHYVLLLEYSGLCICGGGCAGVEVG